MRRAKEVEVRLVAREVESAASVVVPRPARVAVLELLEVPARSGRRREWRRVVSVRVGFYF